MRWLSAIGLSSCRAASFSEHATGPGTAAPLPTVILRTKRSLVDLVLVGHRQLIDEPHVSRRARVPEVSGDQVAQLSRGDAGSRGPDHERGHGLAGPGVRYPDDRRAADPGMPGQHILG